MSMDLLYIPSVSNILGITFTKVALFLKQDAITEGKYLRWFVNAL